MDKNKITINNFEEFKQYLRELIEVDFDDAIFGNGFIIMANVLNFVAFRKQNKTMKEIVFLNEFCMCKKMLTMIYKWQNSQIKLNFEKVKLQGYANVWANAPILQNVWLFSFFWVQLYLNKKMCKNRLLICLFCLILQKIKGRKNRPFTH